MMEGMATEGGGREGKDFKHGELKCHYERERDGRRRLREEGERVNGMDRLQLPNVNTGSYNRLRDGLCDCLHNCKIVRVTICITVCVVPLRALGRC